MKYRCLFHVHTRHSPDSLQPPARIVAEARKRGVQVLIVTDHETTAGAREVRRLAAGQILVPIAAEYRTDKGDVIGIFLKEEIRLGSPETIIKQIREQGGMVVLPHPFKAHRLDDEFLAEMDVIESYNSRCSPLENDAAQELAKRLNRPVIGGADAHCVGELDSVLNSITGEAPGTEEALRQALLTAPREIETRRVSAVFRPYSQMIKAFKTRNAHLFLSQSKRLAQLWVREALGYAK